MNDKDTRPSLPYRGRFGDARPDGLAGLVLPPEAMPSRQGSRPLKAWRYVGVYGPELMLCIGAVRIGRARQAFWAVWDRGARRLYERTVIGHGPITLSYGRARIRDRDVQVDLNLAETGGVETVCPTGDSYAWTRKQGGIRATGAVMIDGRPRSLDARAVIDDTAAYYARHTSWHWSAGVGRTPDGTDVAWNLVSGVNDPPEHSERTVWVAGEPVEVGPSVFAGDLSSVDRLRFASESVRESHDNLLLIRSSYRQPFGTFSGTLPDGTPLAEGYGVMEDHDVYW